MIKGSHHTKKHIQYMKDIAKNNPNYGMRGKHHSEETRQLMRHPRSKEALQRIRNNPNAGMRGKYHTEERKQKIKDNAKNNPNYGMKGKYHTKEAKQKIGIRLKANAKINPNFGTKGKHYKYSKEVLQQIRNNPNAGTKNKHWKLDEISKRNIRIGRFEYIKKTYGILFPSIGHNEKQILDNLEKKLGYKILRQYLIEGYWLDGYIPELNLAIEIDEHYHKKYEERDLIRQEIIENKLGCKFIRIKDFD